MSLHVMSLHVISRRVIHIIIFLISFITSFILFMSFQFVWLACPFNSLTRSPIWGAGFLSPALRSHSCPTSQCRLQNHKYYIPSFWSPWQEGNYKVGAYGCIWNFMFPAHDVHISGVLGKVYWTPATNSKPQTKLHHSNDYRWTVLMPIQRGIPIATFDIQRVQCLPGKASRCQGRFQWPAYTFTSPVRTPVWTHCLGKNMEKPTIRLYPAAPAGVSLLQPKVLQVFGFRVSTVPRRKGHPANLWANQQTEELHPAFTWYHRVSSIQISPSFSTHLNPHSLLWSLTLLSTPLRRRSCRFWSRNACKARSVVPRSMKVRSPLLVHTPTADIP